MVRNLKRKIPPRYKSMMIKLKNPVSFLRDYIRDILSIIGYYEYPVKIIFVAGYPKSGTTWVENFLYQLPGYVPRALTGDKKIIVNQDLPSDAFKIFSKKGYSYVKTHCNPTPENIKILKENNINKVILMWRDPRDIIISRYFHLLKKPKQPWEPNYMDYTKVSKNNGLMNSIEVVSSDINEWIKGWKNIMKNNVIKCLLITYEDLLRNPKKSFRSILDFYGINYNESDLDKYIEKAGKKKKFNIGRSPGHQATFRKGISGDWKNHFTDEHKEKIKEKMGNLLIELGYEKDLNW